MTARSSTAKRAVQGYTLLELMVALGTGLLVIAVAYGLAAASARQFQEQQKIASLQSSVRVALDQLQRDVERAGYLAAPNSRRAPRCGAPAFETQAIEVSNDTQDGIVDPNRENLTHADELIMVGSYATPDQFLISTVDPAFNAIHLQTAWQGFRRNFMDPTGTNIVQAALDNVFVPGRMLMIRATTGNVFYATVTGATVNGLDAVVRFDPPLPIGGPCLGGLATGAVVSVLSRIQYSIVDRTDPDVAALVSTNPQAASLGQQTSVLLRRELQFVPSNDPLQVAGGNLARVVLENAVEFDLDFMVLDNARTPAQLRRFTGATAGPWVSSVNGAPNAQPEQLRSLLVSLAARAAEQDPRYPWAPRRLPDPLSRYRTNPALPGAARVRSARVEITLPNLR